MSNVSDQTGERATRMRLAAVSPPGDPITGELLTQIGAEATLNLLANNTARPPETVDAESVERWRIMLAPELQRTATTDLSAVTEQYGLRVLIPGDPDWPKHLDDLGSAMPYALWTKGDTALLTGPLQSRVTMVGARAATAYGTHVATELAAGLADQGHILVSGGAYGIDADVHRAALTSDSGTTVAIMAGGLDHYYPAGNRELLTRLETGGLLISEHPPGHIPTRDRFSQRARLLASLSALTVIPEAGVRSGTLRVASSAYDLGRWVGTVPGPVTNAASAGCNQLLRNGTAEVITCIADVTALTLPQPTGWALGQEYENIARAVAAPHETSRQHEL